MGMDGRAPQIRFVRRRPFRRPGSEHGAIAIMAVGALLIICAFFSLALDLSRVFNRKMEMQSVADGAALAAAAELDGTKAGITKAMQKVGVLFGIQRMFGGPSFNYRQDGMLWADKAIEFSTSPDGPWIKLDVATAKKEPNSLLYVRVNTAGLDMSYGEVSTFFLPVISSDTTPISVSAHAVAGPSGIAVSPLAVCAMRPEEPKRNRAGELEEFGYRRGVSYDLMQLNPDAADTGKSFLIHPFAGPGATGSSASDFNTVAPFVCTGTMAISRVTGGKIPVSSPFPLNELFDQLNSRFDVYVEPCRAETSPPDKNIMQYVNSTSGVPWMGWVPEKQSANLYADTANHKRWTVAGPDPAVTGTKIVQHGPLWSYSKAVKYADPAPSTGYVSYGTSNWKDLYNLGQTLPGTPSYPSTTTPYMSTNSLYSASPSHPGVRQRRVLNVPLLACPVSDGKATVLGIGKFFMTVKADSTHLYAEFAGLTEEQPLRTRIRLYP